jgi:uncharacterized protein YjiS (DUF1127 family)
MNRLGTCDQQNLGVGPVIGLADSRRGSPVQDFLIRALDHLGRWRDRAGQRRRLMMLDGRMLRDIGMDRATAAEEAAKPFWRA